MTKGEITPEQLSPNLGGYQDAVDAALAEMTKKDILRRIWAHDHTVWKPDPTEITNRLGWLHIADAMSDNTQRLRALTETAREAGYTHALLLGMGGSSLAPELFRKTFGVREGSLDLAVLDSTDPGAVLAQAKRLDMARTLFIVATKSGGTVETLSFFKFFYNHVYNHMAKVIGKKQAKKQAGEHFIAITDPGSDLEPWAKQCNFRDIFLNNPDIGGRYSALSYFGLVAAALVGVDLPKLLNRSQQMARVCGAEVEISENPAARLGAIMGELAKAGRDKITFITPSEIASFGDWVEQLIAESTGKEGKGILPVVGEPLGTPEIYGKDRLFVYLQLAGDATHDQAIAALEQAGHPVVRISIGNLYDLGGQFFLWELATAVAGYRLGINPFDQPNVVAAKALTSQVVANYAKEGALPSATPTLTDGGIDIYGNISASDAGEALKVFLNQAQAGAYVAVQAYVQPTSETDQALLALRTRLRDQTHLPITVGYGPRFLHSTGQLHKGDAGKGLFIQFTGDGPDVDIPDEAGAAQSSISFGALKMAQALGDGQALHDAGRRVIRFHLGTDVVNGLQRLIA